MKRILFTLGALIIIGGVIAFGYFFGGSRGGDDTTSSDSSTGLPPSAPPIGTPAQPTPPVTGTPPGTPLPAGQLAIVSENQVKSFFVDQQGTVTLVQPDGQIAKITGSQTNVLSATAIATLMSVSFSSDGQKIAVTFGDRRAPQASIFDVTSRSWQPPAAVFDRASWSPSGQRFLYLTNKNNASVLTVLDASNSKAKPQDLFTLHQQDLVPHWVGANEILLTERSSAFARSSAWILNTAEKTLSPLAEEQRGLEMLWHPSSSRGLSFVGNTNNRGGALNLINNQGKVIRRFTFTTFPQKCVFETAIGTSTQQFLYCAVPRDQEALGNVPLPDAYQKRAFFTLDDFYKIDLASGAIETIFTDINQDIDADEVMLIGKRLYFVNRFTGKLYALSFTK